MDRITRPPGRAQDFVAARGFDRSGDHTVLLDRDGRGRLFLELATDADHPRSDPEAAYENLFSTLEPGASIRFLQLFWPDDEPRARFIRQTGGWPESESEFLATMKRDLTGDLSAAPLPYLRRTVLEIVLAGGEMTEWVAGAIEILRANGMKARLLEPAEVQELAGWVFNPVLD
ncbi:MAG TPA: hypothetical protein VMN57_04885 [Anaerolineales bacterium]|nr:hypothetical protein [Anaerolineales bacterium]